MREKVIRIGGASGFWGDSSISMPQLLSVPKLDYIVFDYLAETTMAILQRARMKNPEFGYATDFVTGVIKPYLQQCLDKNIKLIANAGGLNPEACAQAIRLCARELGLAPTVAVVLGDDVSPRIENLREQGVTDMQGGKTLPAKVLSANAYLGAQPIAFALAKGAQIVVTGRCVDSAVTLGALAYEFGWAWDDWDRLAQGSLAGHMIECGAQATGGLFTDWQDVPDWANIGYPVLEVMQDGSFDIIKPDNTGGLISVGVCSEQLLYEIGDPARYELPDVICDFRQVSIQQIQTNRVRLEHAKGRPPSQQYKVSVTWQDGYQLTTHQ
ncbi:MAG: acyclic terpene utilization AtuA family protein, partial [Alcaligenaceae bacterium]